MGSMVPLVTISDMFEYSLISGGWKIDFILVTLVQKKYLFNIRSAIYFNKFDNMFFYSIYANSALHLFPAAGLMFPKHKICFSKTGSF